MLWLIAFQTISVYGACVTGYACNLSDLLRREKEITAWDRFIKSKEYDCILLYKSGLENQLKIKLNIVNFNKK